MKKLLLSSIVMLGVCSFATAQNATSNHQLTYANGETIKSAPAATTSVNSSLKKDKTVATADVTTAVDAQSNAAKQATDVVVASDDAVVAPVAADNKKEIKKVAPKKGGN